MKTLLAAAVLLAGAAFIRGAAPNAPILAAESSAPALEGLKCDLSVVMTSDDPSQQPSHKAQAFPTQTVTYKIAQGYWRPTSKTDGVMKPLKMTDDTYVMSEANDETETNNLGNLVRTVSSPFIINRKTGETAMTMTTTMPKFPGVRVVAETTGRCTPIAFDTP
jgi:hypothetical protein